MLGSFSRTCPASQPAFLTGLEVGVEMDLDANDLGKLLAEAANAGLADLMYPSHFTGDGLRAMLVPCPVTPLH